MEGSAMTESNKMNDDIKKEIEQKAKASVLCHHKNIIYNGSCKPYISVPNEDCGSLEECSSFIQGYTVGAAVFYERGRKDGYKTREDEEMEDMTIAYMAGSARKKDEVWNKAVDRCIELLRTVELIDDEDTARLKYIIWKIGKIKKESSND